MPTELKQDKDPQDVDNVTWDWQARLRPGETISAFDAEVTGGDWTASLTFISGARTFVRVEGGTSGTACQVRGRITTSTGRQLGWTIIANIAEQ